MTFDRWFSETPLHTEGHVQGTIDRVLESGDAYRLDDAVWLRTSPYGDDKDRVLIRSNERPTYFAADIAYHQDKLARGYDHLINIWGADHHGYVQRMKAAVEILSHDPDMLELIIGQMVNLLEEGELRQMSTRRGEMVTLGELIDAVGVDAARFFLVMRSHDQTLDLDLGLARQQSQENPVYYVQYAHARIASILRNAPPDLEPSLDVADARRRSLRDHLRAGSDQETGRVRRPGARSRRPPRPSPRGRVCPGGRGCLPPLLQELSRHWVRSGGRGGATGALPGDRTGGGPESRPARRGGSGEHVAPDGCRRVPELPEVETIRRQLAAALPGRRIRAVDRLDEFMLLDVTAD